MMQLANFSENLFANGGQLTSQTATQFSSTAILTSQYLSGVIFLTKYQGFQ